MGSSKTIDCRAICEAEIVETKQTFGIFKIVANGLAKIFLLPVRRKGSYPQAARQLMTGWRCMWITSPKNHTLLRERRNKKCSKRLDDYGYLELDNIALVGGGQSRDQGGQTS